MGQQALSPLSSGHIGNLFLDGSYRLTCNFNQLDPDTQSPKQRRTSERAPIKWLLRDKQKRSLSASSSGNSLDVLMNIPLGLMSGGRRFAFAAAPSSLWLLPHPSPPRLCRPATLLFHPILAQRRFI
jgi:hypothetical protein